MKHSHQTPDHYIDRVLTGFRDTQPTPGLEARIAARLTAALDLHTAPTIASPSLFAIILNAVKTPRILLAEAPLFTLASATLLLISFSILTLHHRSNLIADANTPSQTSPAQPAALDQSTAQNLHAATAQPPKALFSGPRTTLVPQASSLGPHSPAENPGALATPNLDDLALAETLAPSRPAPSMPLTAQEHLLVLATRQGQPIEVAELDLLRAPALQAAERARDRATLLHYAQGLLGPLAAAQALNPASPQDDAQPASPPEPPASK